MKIAVAGYGMMGQSHINSLKALGHSVVAVWGRDKARTEAFTKQNGIAHACTTFEELVELKVEVLHICTPPENHYQLAKQALEHNIHVVCEKPFVMDNSEGEELVELLEKSQLVGAVGFNVRYHEACQRAKAMTVAGKLGDIFLVNGSYLQEFHALPAYYSWRYEDTMLATTEIGSHWIDLMRFLSGKEVVAVSATLSTFFADRVLADDGLMYQKGSAEGKDLTITSDNVALLNFRLSDNSLANVVLSEITPGRYNYLDITVTGSDGSLWWNSEEINRLHIGTKGEPVQTEVLAFTGGFDSSITQMLASVYQDIAAGQMTGRGYATFADGLANTKICNAIYRSAQNNGAWEDI